MKKATIVTLAIMCIITVMATAYDTNPDSYVYVDPDQAIPNIVADFTVTQRTMITTADLPLLSIFFSATRLLAWQAYLLDAPVTTWTRIRSMKYHSFERSKANDGTTIWTPRPERTLVGTRETLILKLFYQLKQ